MSLESLDELAVLEEASEFFKTLPQPLKARLQMNKKYLAVDFINGFSAVIMWHDVTKEDESAAETLKTVITALVSYREYLLRRVREYNHQTPDHPIDDEVFVSKFVGVPFVLDIESKIEELKKINIEPGPELKNTLLKVEKICMNAICFIREEID